MVAAETGNVVAPANYNARMQTVIAGDAAAVELACSRARQEGATRAVPLAVSVPLHCDLMKPAAEKLALELSSVHFRRARPPVVTITFTSARVSRAMSASSVDLPTPDPEKIPMRCPRPRVSSPSMTEMPGS